METSAIVSLFAAIINFFMVHILLRSVTVKMSQKNRILVSLLSSILIMIFFFILSLICVQLSMIPSNL